MCPSCRYPPCTVCEKVARPKKAKYSAKRIKVWTCPECQPAEKQCGQCQEMKPEDAFDQKNNRHYNQICRECQFPKCTGCGEPSKEKWIPNPMQKTEGYQCQDCITHTCQGRCQRQLPAHAFNHKANRTRYPVCRECQHPTCTSCGIQRKKIWTPPWNKKDAMPVCEKCGAKMTTPLPGAD